MTKTRQWDKENLNKLRLRRTRLDLLTQKDFHKAGYSSKRLTESQVTEEFNYLDKKERYIRARMGLR